MMTKAEKQHVHSYVKAWREFHTAFKRLRTLVLKGGGNITMEVKVTAAKSKKKKAK